MPVITGQLPLAVRSRSASMAPGAEVILLQRALLSTERPLAKWGSLPLCCGDLSCKSMHSTLEVVSTLLYSFTEVVSASQDMAHVSLQMYIFVA